MADSQQNAREPTYAHVEVLASYVVPTLSAQARAGTRRKGAPRPVLVLAFAALTGLVAAGMCGGSFVP